MNRPIDETQTWAGCELTPLSNTGALTAMDRFIFDCWGYLLIPDVLSEAECDEALEACKRVHGSQPARKFRQVGRGFENEPALERLIDHPAVLPKIRGILGDHFILSAAWSICTRRHGCAAATATSPILRFWRAPPRAGAH